ncbi:MAG TPA: LemA family protein [Gammaproteobacteria bacterium]|nr:LemA family protein [Gammaproteobacteria bacterium]
MTASFEIAVIVFILISAWAIITYNLLVRDLNRVLAAWSDIDVQLKRRHDLIPKLVDTVKQYASYESSTMEALTELRAQSRKLEDVGRKGELEAELGEKLHRLIAIAEEYPDLKANESFLDLQRNLSDVENNIQYARRYYNGAVRNLNIRIDSFPDMLIAKPLGYRHAQFFDFEEKI